MKKLKLNKLNKNRLPKEQMNSLRGGYTCTCGCCYEGVGGSGTVDNGIANYEHNYETECPQVTWVI